MTDQENMKRIIDSNLGEIQRLRRVLSACQKSLDKSLGILKNLNTSHFNGNFDSDIAEIEEYYTTE
jgi:hypothetical protein